MKWISTFILTAILLLGFSPVVFAAGDTFSTQITSTPTEFSSEPGKMTQDEAKYIARGGSAIPETESSKIASFIERKGFGGESNEVDFYFYSYCNFIIRF